MVLVESDGFDVEGRVGSQPFIKPLRPCGTTGERSTFFFRSEDECTGLLDNKRQLCRCEEPIWIVNGFPNELSGSASVFGFRFQFRSLQIVGVVGNVGAVEFELLGYEAVSVKGKEHKHERTT